MKKAEPTAQKQEPAAPRRTASLAGYQKGQEARQRILDAALQVFAQTGFQAAGTRQIAELAGVTLPSLQYYFGGKQGLYEACAQAVASRFIALTAAPSQAAAAILAGPAQPTALRAALKQTMAAVATVMIATEESRLWGAFAARELLDPGPGFAIMMDRLWSPGIALIAEMMARLQGRERADEQARIRAMLMIASLTAFQSGRAVALRTMGWDGLGAQQLAAILRAIDAEIDSL